MTENNEPGEWQRHKALIVFGLLAPMGYVLSSGPVFWLFNRQTGSEFWQHNVKPLIIAFYSPLNWVCEYVPWLDKPLSRYVDFFCSF